MISAGAAGRREGIAWPRRRLQSTSQVVQDVAALLTAGRDDGQHPLHEPAPVRAVGPAADPTPDHRMTQARSAALFVGSTPSTRANVHSPSSTLRISKQVAAVLAQRHCDPSSRACLTSRRKRRHRSWNRSLHGPVAHPVPVAEQPVRQRKQPPAGRFTVAAPVDHRLEVAPQMAQQTCRQRP